MSVTLAPITSALDAYAAAGAYFDAIDDGGSWQAAATIAVSYEYATPYGVVECSVTREDVAKARAHGLI